MINQKQAKGFTLIELLLVFVVIIGIVLASYHRYQQYTLNKDLAAIKQNVALLMNAANAYYARLASDRKTNPALRKDDLPELSNLGLFLAGLWPTNLLHSNLVTTKDLKVPVKNAYVVSASTGILIKSPAHQLDTPYYTHQLKVTVTLDTNVVDINSMDWYLKKLGASKNPSDTQLQWIQMPGYPIKGINSNLWMLEGGLGTFKKGLEGTVTP
jgi:type II secretory pathway pseudopilin PulG